MTTSRADAIAAARAEQARLREAGVKGTTHTAEQIVARQKALHAKAQRRGSE